MLTVTQLARRSGTTPHAVRYYTRMEQAMLEWADKPDGIPDGDSVCYLIESFGAEPD